MILVKLSGETKKRIIAAYVQRKGPVVNDLVRRASQRIALGTDLIPKRVYIDPNKNVVKLLFSREASAPMAPKPEQFTATINRFEKFLRTGVAHKNDVLKVQAGMFGGTPPGRDIAVPAPELEAAVTKVLAHLTRGMTMANASEYMETTMLLGGEAFVSLPKKIESSKEPTEVDKKKARSKFARLRENVEKKAGEGTYDPVTKVTTGVGSSGKPEIAAVDIPKQPSDTAKPIQSRDEKGAEIAVPEKSAPQMALNKTSEQHIAFVAGLVEDLIEYGFVDVQNRANELRVLSTWRPEKVQILKKKVEDIINTGDYSSFLVRNGEVHNTADLFR